MLPDDLANKIRNFLGDALKAAGFQKKGKNGFLRQCEDVLQFIEFQKSVKTSDSSLTFSINLGVYSQRLAREGEKPEVASCHWRTRLGNLMPAPQDRWWDVESEDDAGKASREVLSLLTDYGLPMLDQISSTSRLKELWRKNQSPGLTQFQRQEYLRMLEGS